MSCLSNNEGAFTMLRGNQRGITILYASSFACSWAVDIGPWREWRFYEDKPKHTHAHTPISHKVAFTVGVLILCGWWGHHWCAHSNSKRTFSCKILLLLPGLSFLNEMLNDGQTAVACSRHRPADRQGGALLCLFQFLCVKITTTNASF